MPPRRRRRRKPLSHSARSWSVSSHDHLTHADHVVVTAASAEQAKFKVFIGLPNYPGPSPKSRGVPWQEFKRLSYASELPTSAQLALPTV